MRFWRLRRGISQEELAGRAGLHRTYVSDVERGARNLSLESIHKLAEALEISVAKLFPQREGFGQRGETGTDMVDLLLVEDHAPDIELTLAALKSANITNQIHVLRDGAAALDFLFCTGPHANRKLSDNPQIVLLDLKLPKVSGLEVLRRLKSDPRTREIAVVVLTGSQRDHDFIASKQLGADAYLTKPVEFQNLSQVTSQLSLQWALLKDRNARFLA